MIDTPENLYKYLPAFRAGDILKTLVIRFSQVSVLNDALEFKPPIEGLATRPQLEELIRERLRSKYPETATDTLLWSLYADGGRGSLIEFDPKHPWFWGKRSEDDDFHHIHRVGYASRRPRRNLLEMSAEDFLYTKGTVWEHEKEWRIIRSFREAALKAGKDLYGKDVLLFAIPPDCVLRVVIGYRTSPEFVEQMKHIVTGNPALSHLRFSKAIFTKDSLIQLVSEV